MPDPQPPTGSWPGSAAPAAGPLDGVDAGLTAAAAGTAGVAAPGTGAAASDAAGGGGGAAEAGTAGAAGGAGSGGQDAGAGRLEELADRLERAALRGEPVGPVRDGLSLADAYAVQRIGVARARDRGRRVAGRKVGLTSRVMQQQLGVDEPDFGVLLDDMLLDDGADLAAAPRPLIRPRVEAEIAFVLGSDLAGPGVTTLDALRATEAVAASLEIIDSRVRDWDIRLVDTVADNASSAYAVLGGRLVDPRDLDLRLVGTALSVNGRVVESGAGAAVLGHPAACVAWLANTLAGYGETLTAGSVVLSGALCRAVDLAPGDAALAEFAGLGTVRVVWTATDGGSA